jgi:hypothetical protein
MRVCGCWEACERHGWLVKYNHGLGSRARCNRRELTRRGLNRRRGDSRASFEQNAAASTAVSRWGQTPLLHVGLYENKAALSKIDIEATGTIGTNSGKEGRNC